MTAFEDRPQLPLTPVRRVLVGVGVALFVAQLAAAAALAPVATGDGASAGLLALLWLASLAWSTAVALLVVRQAEMADVATASFIATIAPHVVFALVAALDARGTNDEVDLVDAVFFGVTAGALAALLVWPAAMGIARLLRMPRGPAA